MSALILIGNTIITEARSPKEAERWILKNQSRYDAPLWIEPTGTRAAKTRKIRSAEEMLEDAAKEDEAAMWNDYWMQSPGDEQFLSEL